MARYGRPRNRKSARPGIIQSGDKASGGIETRLGAILKDLARVLVCNGYGIAALNRLAKRAYFEAALELDSATGRRRNHARLAAATGLTRAEVSRLSRTPIETFRKRPVSRAQRVSTAW